MFFSQMSEFFSHVSVSDISWILVSGYCPQLFALRRAKLVDAMNAKRAAAYEAASLAAAKATVQDSNLSGRLDVLFCIYAAGNIFLRDVRSVFFMGFMGNILVIANNKKALFLAFTLALTLIKCSACAPVTDPRRFQQLEWMHTLHWHSLVILLPCGCLRVPLSVTMVIG